jgi:hypothetical protein
MQVHPIYISACPPSPTPALTTLPGARSAGCLSELVPLGACWPFCWENHLHDVANYTQSASALFQAKSNDRIALLFLIWSTRSVIGLSIGGIPEGGATVGRAATTNRIKETERTD